MAGEKAIPTYTTTVTVTDPRFAGGAKGDGRTGALDFAITLPEHCDGGALLCCCLPAEPRARPGGCACCLPHPTCGSAHFHCYETTAVSYSSPHLTYKLVAMLLLADDTEAFAQAIRAASALALNMTTTACRTGRCPVRAASFGGVWGSWVMPRRGVEELSWLGSVAWQALL